MNQKIEYMWKDMHLCLLLKTWVHIAEKSATDVIKTASKRAIRNTAEATCDLIGNKIPDKITNVSKQYNKELPKEWINTHKKRYIPPEEKQQIINELRLIPKKDT